MSPTDFLLYSLCLSELFKVVHLSKPLGMSSVFYLVAVTGDLSGIALELLAALHNFNDPSCGVEDENTVKRGFFDTLVCGPMHPLILGGVPKVNDQQ